MADFSEVLTEIRRVMTADSTLTGLLGDANQIYRGRDVPTSAKFPAIRLWMIDDAPNFDVSGYGDFRPRLQIDLIGPDPTKLDAIRTRLDELLTIPYKRSTVITSAGFTVRQMLRTGPSLNLGEIGIQDSTGRAVQHVATEWDLKVTAK